MNPVESLETRLRDLGYSLDSPMAAAMVAKVKQDFDTSLRSAELTFTLTGVEADKLIAAFADMAADQPSLEPVEWGCCDDPQPRILETNNRLFCFNCRVYLDQREEGGARDEA